MSNPRITCQICKKTFLPQEVFPAQMVRPSLEETIRKTYPNWSPDGYICLADLNQFRINHIQDSLDSEKGELTRLENEVITSFRENETISKDVDRAYDEKLAFGDRFADRLASFGGSWTFILFFGCVILGWVAINSVFLFMRPFDPYPFILLNLVLSCLAAFQAPVIMMSQNRQEAKDRLRSEHDYQVNLKAELEIRHLNERIDYLLSHQWQRLMEIQQMQMEMIGQLQMHHRSHLSGQS